MKKSTLVEDVERVSALRALDLIESSDVVDWASTHVVDSPLGGSMVHLASLMPPFDSEEVSRSLDDLLIEVGREPLDLARAGRAAAKHIARCIVERSVEPEVGANRMWSDVALKVPALESQLLIFNGLSSMWEDDVSHWGEYEAEIIAAAQDLVEPA